MPSRLSPFVYVGFCFIDFLTSFYFDVCLFYSLSCPFNLLAFFLFLFHDFHLYFSVCSTLSVSTRLHGRLFHLFPTLSTSICGSLSVSPVNVMFYSFISYHSSLSFCLPSPVNLASSFFYSFLSFFTLLSCLSLSVSSNFAYACLPPTILGSSYFHSLSTIFPSVFLSVAFRLSL